MSHSNVLDENTSVIRMCNFPWRIITARQILGKKTTQKGSGLRKHSAQNSELCNDKNTNSFHCYNMYACKFACACKTTHVCIHVCVWGHVLCLFPLTYSDLHKFYLLDKIGKLNMAIEKDTVEVFRNFGQSHNY